MSLDFLGKWISFIFFTVAAFAFYYEFVCSLKRTKDNTDKAFRDAAHLKLFLALQMTLGLYYVLQINPPVAAAHVGASGLMMLVNSFKPFKESFKLKNGNFVTKMAFLCPLFGFLFLILHIVW